MTPCARTKPLVAATKLRFYLKQPCTLSLSLPLALFYLQPLSKLLVVVVVVVVNLTQKELRELQLNHFELLTFSLVAQSQVRKQEESVGGVGAGGCVLAT